MSYRVFFIKVDLYFLLFKNINANKSNIPKDCKKPCRYTPVYFKHSLSKTGVKLQIIETINI